MPKMTTDNPPPSNGKILFQELGTKLPVPGTLPQDSFLVDIQEFSSHLYAFRAKDLDHALTCEMTLERQENFVYSQEISEEEGHLMPVIACNFPPINVQKFNENVYGDEYLQGIIMFQFQLKILEQLFLFCEEKDAVHLILTIHETNQDYLEIYSRFFVSEERVTTAKGEQIKITIPTDVETYDAVVDFMDEIDKDLRRTLWRGQKANLAFRAYLKRYPSLVV